MQQKSGHVGEMDSINSECTDVHGIFRNNDIMDQPCGTVV